MLLGGRMDAASIYIYIFQGAEPAQFCNMVFIECVTPSKLNRPPKVSNLDADDDQISLKIFDNVLSWFGRLSTAWSRTHRHEVKVGDASLRLPCSRHTRACRWGSWTDAGWVRTSVGLVASGSALVKLCRCRHEQRKRNKVGELPTVSSHTFISCLWWAHRPGRA